MEAWLAWLSSHREDILVNSVANIPFFIFDVIIIVGVLPIAIESFRLFASRKSRAIAEHGLNVTIAKSITNFIELDVAGSFNDNGRQQARNVRDAAMRVSSDLSNIFPLYVSIMGEAEKQRSFKTLALSLSVVGHFAYLAEKIITRGGVTVIHHHHQAKCETDVRKLVDQLSFVTSFYHNKIDNDGPPVRPLTFKTLRAFERLRERHTRPERFGADVDGQLFEAIYDEMADRIATLTQYFRSMVSRDDLDHPAYADGAFPFWWFGRNDDIYLNSKKPPLYVRLHVVPMINDQGFLVGVTNVDIVGHKGLSDMVVSKKINDLFLPGQVITSNGLEIIPASSGGTSTFRGLRETRISTTINWLARYAPGPD